LDGGYGWVVVFGAFFVQFWVAGLVKSYGVLYVEVMETFKDSSASVASWIPAILTCLCLALGELVIAKASSSATFTSKESIGSRMKLAYMIFHVCL
jgi:hypothetical protein